MNGFQRNLWRLAAALALFGGVHAAHAAPPLRGAIFTTTVDGSRVNANIYSAKCDAAGVYLDGGPGANAPQGAAGLPDGDYFFQVTDPSGQTLLSTDAQRFRRFTVTGGIITARVTPAAPGDHDTGIDVDHGALTVELCPYLDTPNPGGEYKVWVTPVADFAGNPNIVDNGYNPGYFHGFLPAASKTDNFKIKARKSVCLTHSESETRQAAAGSDCCGPVASCDCRHRGLCRQQRRATARSGGQCSQTGPVPLGGRREV